MYNVSLNVYVHAFILFLYVYVFKSITVFHTMFLFKQWEVEIDGTDLSVCVHPRLRQRSLRRRATLIALEIRIHCWMCQSHRRRTPSRDSTTGYVIPLSWQSHFGYNLMRFCALAYYNMYPISHILCFTGSYLRSWSWKICKELCCLQDDELQRNWIGELVWR